MAIYKIQTKGSNGMVDLPVDAKSLDGHKVEATGVASNTTTIPTTAQVKTYTDGKFVAYDTNAQGLTTTQKSNARTNIGAGTSNLTIGTTATTACAGNDSRLSDARTPTSHAHGNITNGGDITATGVTIANGDALVIRDSSASKLAKTSITFDGSTTTKFLSQKGTWESAGSSSSKIPFIARIQKSGTFDIKVMFYKSSSIISTGAWDVLDDIAESSTGVSKMMASGWVKTSSNAYCVVTDITQAYWDSDEDDLYIAFSGLIQNTSTKALSNSTVLEIFGGSISGITATETIANQ